MKTRFSSVLVLILIWFGGNSAFAQKKSQEKPQEKPQPLARPAGVETIKFPWKQTLHWLGMRFYEVGVDALFEEMTREGIGIRHFVLSSSGALFPIESESEVSKQENSMIGRDSGRQFLSYDVALLLSSSGEKRISVSFYRMKNMVEYEAAERALRGEKNLNFWSFVDGMEFITLTWDNGYAFKDAWSYDCKLAKIEPKFNLFGSDSYTFNLRASTDIGWGKTYLNQSDGTRAYLGYAGEKTGVDATTQKEVDNGPVYKNAHGSTGRWNYSLGLEYNKKFKDGSRLKLFSDWKGGHYNHWTHDSDIMMKNIKVKNQYDIDKTNYDAAVAQHKSDYLNFSIAKEANLTKFGLPLATTDEVYFKQFGIEAPRGPADLPPAQYQMNIVRADRIFGYISGALSYTKRLNPKATGQRPLLLQSEIEWNIPVKDEFRRPPKDLIYDYASSNRRLAVVRVYFKF